MKRLFSLASVACMFAFVAATLALAFLPATANAQASAKNGYCNARFLTVPAWYNGINKAGADGSCDIISPTEAGGFAPFIWTIALNIVEILLNVAGYVAVGFIIFGGIKYMTAAGSSDGMVAARKTIMNAVVGLLISILSIAIVNIVANNIGTK